VILASNHVSWFDPPVVGGTFRRSPVRTIAKRELFAGPLLKAAFRWLDAIPIERRGVDARAFRAARDALARGACLFFFPEGTRRPPGRPGPVKGGLGLLALATGAPVLPIHVRGTHALAWGGNPDVPLEVRYGPLVRLHALPHLEAALGRRVAAERVGTLFQAILDELMARSYAETPPGPRELELQDRARGRGRVTHPSA
jgi:1-acyl-sn-glycerol-3-phosphate acyltransferase